MTDGELRYEYYEVMISRDLGCIVCEKEMRIFGSLRSRGTSSMFGSFKTAFLNQRYPHPSSRLNLGFFDVRIEVTYYRVDKMERLVHGVSLCSSTSDTVQGTV